MLFHMRRGCIFSSLVYDITQLGVYRSGGTEFFAPWNQRSEQKCALESGMKNIHDGRGMLRTKHVKRSFFMGQPRTARALVQCDGCGATVRLNRLAKHKATKCSARLQQSSCSHSRRPSFQLSRSSPYGRSVTSMAHFCSEKVSKNLLSHIVPRGTERQDGVFIFSGSFLWSLQQQHPDRGLTLA